ncbi:MAG TPA: PQQ-binding-like beta-propeller repeat protein [Streptosporangiaceae bacterium]
MAVPASALPGRHWVTGNGRRSKRSAQAPFTVRVGWPQFRRSPDHGGYNATENVLSPSTVSGMDLNWSYRTCDSVFSSPAVANGTVYIGSVDHRVYAFGLPGGMSGGTRRLDPATLRPDQHLRPSNR